MKKPDRIGIGAGGDGMGKKRGGTDNGFSAKGRSKAKREELR